MTKYLKFLEDMYDGNKLVWKKDGLYKVSYHNPDVYYITAENTVENYGIDTKSEGKKYVIIEKDEEA